MAKRGRKAGYSHTQETKAKIRDSLRGRKRPAETRAAISRGLERHHAARWTKKQRARNPETALVDAILGARPPR